MKKPLIHYKENPSFNAPTKGICGYKGGGTYTSSPAFATCEECLKIMKQQKIENAGIAYADEHYNSLPNNN